MQRFTAGDGLELAWVEDDFTDAWREARPLVLLHAAMGDSLRYSAWVPHLAGRYRVIRMDLRGHGCSAIPPERPALTMDRLVADVHDLMAHLGLERAHFVGNSAGGYVAQNLAMSAPDKVISLSLFGSTPGLKNSQAASWLPQVAEKGIRRFVTETIADRFPLDATEPGRVQWFIDSCARNDPEYIMRFVRLMTTLDWSDRLAAIRCPTLIVVPGAETVGSTRNYDVMRDTIPDVELVSFEGMPHNICDAVPHRCAEEVLRFLDARFGDRAGD
jgi:3-oxoadipate enol-lactonase